MDIEKQEEIKRMIVDCEKRAARLLEFEIKRVEMMKRKVDGGGVLSQLEDAQLTRIWQVATEKG